MSGVYETSLMHRLFNYDHLLGRRPMSSKTGASGSYLSTPMDVLPLSRRRFYPSGYGDRVGELRVDPGANWPLNFPLPSFGKKREKNWSHGWKMDKDRGRSCRKRYTKRPTALVCWCQTVCWCRNANQNSVVWFLENQLICWLPMRVGRKSPHSLKFVL